MRENKESRIAKYDTSRVVDTRQACVELIYSGSDSEKNVYRKIFTKVKKKCIVESKNPFAMSCHKANETDYAMDRWCNKI